MKHKIYYMVVDADNENDILFFDTAELQHSEMRQRMKEWVNDEADFPEVDRAPEFQRIKDLLAEHSLLEAWPLWTEHMKDRGDYFSACEREINLPEVGAMGLPYSVAGAVAQELADQAVSRGTVSHEDMVEFLKNDFDEDAFWDEFGGPAVDWFEDQFCSECGAGINDGEGHDGKCGNCADKEGKGE